MRTLTIAKENIIHTFKESELLQLLAVNVGNVVKRELALNQIRKEDFFLTTKSMDDYVTKLRKHLRMDTAHEIKITNLHG